MAGNKPAVFIFQFRDNLVARTKAFWTARMKRTT